MTLKLYFEKSKEFETNYTRLRKILQLSQSKLLINKFKQIKKKKKKKKKKNFYKKFFIKI